MRRSPVGGRRRTVGVARGLATLWLAASCAPVAPTAYEEAVADFVEAWGASSVLCEAPMVCGLGQPGPCAVAQRPAEEIDAGVRHAHLDPHAMLRCETSAGDFGACIAGLDCITLPQLDELCEAEQERYVIDCAALLVALDYLDTGGTGGSGGSTGGSGGAPGTGGAPATGGAGSGGQGTGGGPIGVGGRPGTGGAGTGGQGTGGQGTGGFGSGGEGSGGGPGGSQGILATALCERAEECVGGRWSTEEQASCEAEAIALFGPIIPDPDTTQSCLRAAPCLDLASDLATLVVECVDHDVAANLCQSPSVLQACTFDGFCSNQACRDVCRADGQLTLGCGAGSPAAGDECLCGN